VFYQIFPDTFANGDSANDVTDGEFLYNDNYPSRSRPWGGHCSYWGDSGYTDFFNGDLLGIEQHLDYLDDLGVNALYLTPIFTSHSQHRYSTLDFYNVDPHLGGNQALLSLKEAMFERGMRLILDITANHCSQQHPWFTEAINNVDAPTINFFVFTEYPDEYRGWLGDPSLPELNYGDAGLQEIMVDGAEAILKYWLRPPYNVDGWRLDASNRIGRRGTVQLAQQVGRAMRRAVKSVSSEKYLMGENFFDPTEQLQGDQLDAIQNETGAGIPILMWVAPYLLPRGPFKLETGLTVQISSKELALQWYEFQKAIPWCIVEQQFNQITNHDSPRLMTLLNNDSSKVKLSLTLLMTYPGVPCFFYGDEIGMTGKNALESRSCMIWDSVHWNLELYHFIKGLIRIRRKSSALCNGGFQILAIGTDMITFVRDSVDECMLIVASRVASASFEIPVRYAGVPDGISFIEQFSGIETPVANGKLVTQPFLEPSAQIWLAGVSE
jgi:alpha-glucosidase